MPISESLRKLLEAQPQVPYDPALLQFPVYGPQMPQGGFETDPGGTIRAAGGVSAPGPDMFQPTEPIISPETLYALGLTEEYQPRTAPADPVGPLDVVPETAPAPTPAPEPQPRLAPEATRRLPDIQQPGDLARARAQRQLSQLSGLRGLTEAIGGIGTARTKSEIMMGMPRQQFQAETLRRREAAAEAALTPQAVPELKQLKPKEIEGYEGYRNFLSVAENIRGKIDQMKSSLGPLDARLDAAAETLGWSKPEVAEFRRQVTNQLNLHIKEMTGAQLSKHEAARLLRGMPRLTDTHGVFRAKLEGVMQEVQQKARQWTRMREKLGYDVSFVEPAETIRAEVGGRIANVPINDWEEFQEEYPGARIIQ